MISHYQLRDDDKNVDFVIRTMSDVEIRNDHTIDEPHRHNYYTIIWSQKAFGAHKIDFKEYDISTTQSWSNCQ